MKYLLIFTLSIAPIVLFSQAKYTSNKSVRKENLAYYNLIFEEYEKEFDVTDAPEKWKDEPIVMLCQKTHISFLRNTTTNAMETKGVIRKRFIIQDKSQLEDFSEFYFQTSEVLGITHVKSNGEKRTINTENAIKVETSIPDFYSDNYHFDEYFKIAIPDLEVGDIIDFYKVFKQRYPGLIQLISTIDNDYPIVSQEIVFDVDKLWTFYYNTFNGAPDLKLEPEGGFDNTGRKRKSVKRLTLKDKDREATDIENWSYRYTFSPVIKFAVVAQGSAYTDNREAIHKGMKMENIIDNNYNIQNALTNKTYYDCSLIAKEVDIHKISSSQEKAELLYRLLKYYCLTNYMLDDFNEKESFDAGALTELSYDYFSMNSAFFATVYTNLLKYFDVKSEYVAVIPEYYGGINDVVTPDEVMYGVYIPSGKKYFWPSDNFTLAGEENKEILGATGYRIPKKSSFDENSMTEISIPYSSADRNIFSGRKSIILNDDNSISVNETLDISGLFKSSYNRFFLYNSTFSFADVNKFETNKKFERIKNFKNKGYENEDLKWKDKKISKYAERLEDFETTHTEQLNEWISSEYRTDSLSNYKVLDYGVVKSAPNLKVSYDFISSEYVKKAGPNLIFELGSLIGDQLELDEDQMGKRTSNIHFNYSKTILNEIEVTLPDGLTANGLEALNMNVDNNSGSFVATASQTGNKIIVKTSKIYKQSHAQLSAWPGYVEMLEAAYEFTQQKVILK